MPMKMNSREEIKNNDKDIKNYIAPGLGLIGGLMLMFASFIFFSEYSIVLPLYPLLIIPEIVTPILATSSILSSLLIIIEKRIGKYFLLLTGIIATATFFIPIQTIMMDEIYLNITISGSFLIIDPFLVLLGGGLSFLLNN